MPAGRPSKYDPKFCQMLIDHMAKGYSYETFGALINVAQSNVANWESKHPEFQEAKREAFGKCRLFWESLGINYIINVSERDPDGYSKSTTLNNAAWIFNMKNRFKWTDRVEVQGSGDETKPLVLAYKT